MQTTTGHLFVDTLGARVISRRGFVKGSKKSATAPLLRGCFTGYNKMKNRDVQLCGTAWLHPEIPFCTQTGLSICKDTTSSVINVLFDRFELNFFIGWFEFGAKNLRASEMHKHLFTVNNIPSICGFWTEK